MKPTAKNTLEYATRAPLQQTLVITPISQHILFLPRTHTYKTPISHTQSCAPPVDEFVGRQGIFIKGVTKNVSGVSITVWDGEDIVMQTVTDQEGKYVAGPLAPEGQYRLVR